MHLRTSNPNRQKTLNAFPKSPSLFLILYMVSLQWACLRTPSGGVGDRDSDLNGTAITPLGYSNRFGNLFDCSRLLSRFSSDYQPPFRMFYIKSKRGQKREAVIMPDLRPERLGRYQVAYQDRSVTPLDFENHFATGDWMTSNLEIIHREFPGSSKYIGDYYSFYTSTGLSTAKFKKKYGSMKGLVDIRFDLKKGDVSRMSINEGEGMRGDQEWFPGMFYQVGDRPIQSASFPAMGDEPSIFIRGSCSENLTRGIFASVKVKKVITTTTNEGRKEVKVKGYINPTIAGRDAECVKYANAYDSKGNLYGIITAYDPVEEGFNPENLEITSIHDDRLKAYIRYAFAPDYRGNGVIFSGKQIPVDGQISPRWFMSQADYWACELDPKYLDKLALARARYKASGYMEKPNCAPEDLEAAFCQARRELEKLVNLNKQALKPKPALVCPQSKIDNLDSGIKSCGPDVTKSIGQSCKNPKAE